MTLDIKSGGPGYFLPGDMIAIPDTGEAMRVTGIRQWWESRIGFARRVSKQRRRVSPLRYRGTITVVRPIP